MTTREEAGAQGLDTVARLFNVPIESAIVILAGTKGDHDPVDSIPGRVEVIGGWLETEQITYDQLVEALDKAKRALATGEWPTGSGISLTEAKVVLSTVLTLWKDKPAA